MIGYAVTGSFCTHKKSLECLKMIIDDGYEVIPILSETVLNTDTRFGKALEFRDRIEDICNNKCISTVVL